jgi:LacI family transcriptional regulator
MVKEKDTTIRALAGRLNISPSTVSLALNGRRPTGFVSASTRQQVWRAAEEMGYPMEKLRSRRPLLERVGIFARTHNTVYAESLLELCRVLNNRGVEVVIHAVETEFESVAAAKELIHKREVDGAVFVGSRRSHSDVLSPDLLESLPSVYIGEVHDGANVWQVRPDNEGGGRAIAEHLWSQGHRNIAVFSSVNDQFVSRRRQQGIYSVWERSGMPLTEENTLLVDSFSWNGVEETITRFVGKNRALSKEERITAIFCYNDWNAGQVLRILKRQGVRVPEDISLVGFDNAEYTLLLDPQLTTVEQPFSAIGTMAADLLLEQMEVRLKGEDTSARVVVAPCKLIVRESTTKIA